MPARDGAGHEHAPLGQAMLNRAAAHHLNCRSPPAGARPGRQRARPPTPLPRAGPSISRAPARGLDGQSKRASTPTADHSHTDAWRRHSR
jgi:hypothetical protein